jgi:hypothetical protein
MKNLFLSIAIAIVNLGVAANSIAQTDERHNKVEMVVVQGGKTIKTELNSVSTSVTRYIENEESNGPSVADVSDTGKAKHAGPVPVSSRSAGDFYLTIETRNLSPEMMRIFSKSNFRFDGTITVTEQFKQTPARTIKFKQAAVYSYSDQYSSVPYTDTYGNAVLSLSCKGLSVDGITLEP